MSAIKSSFISTLVVLFFPFALTINLVNFFWMDALFVGMTIFALALANRSWSGIKTAFGLNERILLCFLCAYFFSGILGYILNSPMQAHELSKIANLRWIWGFFACFSAGHLIASRKTKAHWSFAIVLVVLVLIAVKHYQQTNGEFFSQEIRTQGFYSNPNYFAMAVVVLWALILSFAIYSTDLFSRITTGLILVLGSAILLATYTRTAWIAMALVTATALLYTKNKKVLAISVVAAGVFGIAVLFNWFDLKERILYSFNFSSSSSQGARFAIWNATWHIFLDHPLFGVGFEHAAKLYRTYYVELGQPTDYVPGHAHNQFLDILSGAGLVGLLGYMGAFGSGVIFFHKKFKSATETLSKQLSLGALLSIVALFGCSMTETPIIQQETRNYILIILGFAYGYLSEKDKKEAAR
ncbi:O-antigen ligase family protein [Bdellovibrio bacteriovorus]|uniref:O-antigen ligase family protein n=1 Tax=Bdellovibrio bacteriovorus TaxID=959 RepID=UPI003A813DC4